MQKPASNIEAKEIRKLGMYFLGFAALLSILVTLKYARTGGMPWQVYLAGGFAAAGTACLALGERAEGIYRAWTALGLLMGKVVSPLVLGILYYIVLTPFGIALRMAKPDPLGMKIRRDGESYWREPEIRKSSKASLLRQF
ncbi:MAG: hypothetical protein ABI036_05225 [Fibrobacteria bacterium]